ncbi:MAG: hypothetical protein HYZ42_04125 [Bacteroidetes bacterium]|nr:hypothetical protein [Bacteroidota bacterium]
MKTIFSIDYKDDRWCAVAVHANISFFFVGADPGSQLVNIKRLGDLMSGGKEAIVKGNISRLFVEQDVPNHAFINLLFEKTNTLAFAETELFISETIDGDLSTLFENVEDAGRALIEYVLA